MKNSRKSNASTPQLSQALSKIDRTGQGLRDALFDEIDAIRAGKGDRRQAMAVATLASKVMETVKVEIELARQSSLSVDQGQLIQQMGHLRLGR